MDAKQLATRIVEIDSWSDYSRRVLVSGVEVFSGDSVLAEQKYTSIAIALEQQLIGMGFGALQESAR